MLDAHPAPADAARLPAAVTALDAPPTVSPSKPSALLAAARTLLPTLETGRALDAPTLREAMVGAFGASDAQGAWLWKDAYEAAEATMVLFLQRYGRAMRREAGPGPDGPAAMLRMLETRLGPDRLHTCHMSLSTAEPLWLSHPTHLKVPSPISLSQTTPTTLEHAALR